MCKIFYPNILGTFKKVKVVVGVVMPRDSVLE